jgi:hypothetical protein
MRKVSIIPYVISRFYDRYHSLTPLLSLIRLIARVRFLRFFHLPFLFFLPPFYTWLAFGVILRVSSNDSEYRQWLCEQPTELQTSSHTTPPNEEIDSESTQAPPSQCPTLLSSMPESLLDIRVAWNTFVDNRMSEWKTSVTIASVFVACVYLNSIFFPGLTVFKLKRIPCHLPDPSSD